jgi:uncharacterized membrane protein HdeD (DUF308 family)
MQKSGIPIPALARRYWQMSIVRGTVLILCGLLAIFWPHLTLKLFFILCGVFAIIEGGALLISALARRTSLRPGQSEYFASPSRPVYSNPGSYIPSAQKNWTILLVESILSMICGLLCLLLPALAAVLAIYIIAAWAVFKGIVAITQMARRGRIMGLIGGLATLLGLTLLFNPPGAIRAFLWSIGLLALIMGVLLVTRGIRHHAATPSWPFC